MIYAAKIAFRQLASSLGQTLLLIFGVATGVAVFIFMSALIGGLAILLTQRTVGSIPSVTIEPALRDPTPIVAPGAEPLAVVQKALDQREQIRSWQPVVQMVESLPGVTAVSPQIRGNAFLVRGQAILPVGVIGVQPSKLSAISNIDRALVAGRSMLRVDGIIIGSILADDLGLGVGQTVRIRSDRGNERNLVIGGIYNLGISSADRQTAYVNFDAARALFDLPSGISRIELKVSPVSQAPVIASGIARSTGLKVTPWQEENGQLFEALQAQGMTGNVIKTFAMITIAVGIASAMMLSIVRRRSEIGIMRAAGASRRFILSLFVLQGVIIGLGGALLGAALAGLALSPFPPVTETVPGSLPVERGEGDFLLAVVLTVIAAALASVLPARSASRIDPVEAIGQ